MCERACELNKALEREQHKHSLSNVLASRHDAAAPATAAKAEASALRHLEREAASEGPTK
eukprot:887431-Amphidinium_carterae.1